MSKSKIIRHLALAGLLAIPNIMPAQEAPGVDEFKALVLDKTAPSTVQKPDKVKITQVKATKDGKPVASVKAANTQDAINAATANLRKTGRPLAVIETANGPGVVVFGTANYREVPNRNASLILKNLAAQRAYMEARGSLAEFFGGLSSEYEARMVSSIDAYDAATGDSLANTTTVNQKTTKQKLAGMIAGVAVYLVNDIAEDQRYEVCLVSTPRTRGQTLQVSGGYRLAKDLASGMEAVYAELRSGIIPPMGGRVLTVPSTGGTVFVGFGSAIKRINRNVTIERELAKAARLEARMEAAKSLHALMLGNKLIWSRGSRMGTQDSQDQYRQTQADDLATKNHIETVVEPLEQTRAKFVSVYSQRQEFKLAGQGKLPPGVLPFAFETEDWAYFAYVYSIELEALADQGRKGMEKTIAERAAELKRTLAKEPQGPSTQGQPRSVPPTGSRRITPSGDRKDFGNDRPIGRAPSGRVTKDKDL